ncbi:MULTISPECIES: alpha/beta fold hydrolase [unclassified Thalassospira]|uniref:alpha/beta fold hydrolase n=1 Tax=unclassified Thalassospira TaxID=2648997 RepID=UPI0025D349AC|nr:MULTISPECIES: alpha/beta hydrolase [unclassified Thalassospira]|tara:strand:- start:1798 stop:2718 length:921 start_codon:yes stop_codon:yes gene_type:complete
MTFTTETLETPDGIKLRFGVQTPENAGQHILILQGRGEYIERYQETADELAARGFGCVTFDFRGHGGSSRETDDPVMGYIRDVAHYIADTDHVIEHVKQAHGIECPCVLTHSTGGLVAMTMMLDQPGLWENAVMVAPFFGLGGHDWLSLAAQFVADSMCRYGFDKQYLPGQAKLSPLAEFEPDNILTSDATRYARNVAILKEHPNLVVGGVSAGWLDACFKAQASVSDRIEQMKSGQWLLPPITMVLAGNDQVVSNQITEDLFGGVPSVTITEIPEARHEILQERDLYRDKFWQAFDAHIARCQTA